MARRRRPTQGYDTAINITSLVDVTMLLLLIFMLVAPVLNQGIELELPEATTGTSEPEQGLKIALGPDGEILLDGKPVMPRSLDQELRDRAEQDADLPVLVEGDHRLQYGAVLDVLDRARLAGLTHVSLATQPRKETP